MIMRDFISPNIKFQTVFYNDRVERVGMFIPQDFFMMEIFQDMSGNTFKVFIVLLSHMSSTTYSCYPTVDQLCEYTWLSRPSVISCIKNLKDMGIIKIVKRRNKKNPQQYNNVYHFSRECIEALTVEMMEYSDQETKKYFNDLDEDISMDDLVDEVEDVEDFEQ